MSEMKISKPPQICIFSGQEPVPKEEGNYDQWEFQVRSAIATHTENSMRAAIVNSLQGPVRDLVGFVGFDTNLEKILMEVTNRFGKRYTGDKLQQEFYKLSQEKGRRSVLLLDDWSSSTGNYMIDFRKGLMNSN